MATMTVSLPDPMRDWVEARVRTGRYGNTSDSIRDLIRRDQERSEKISAMQRLVDEAMASGRGKGSMDSLRGAARDQTSSSPTS